MCFFTVKTLTLELAKLVRCLFLCCGCFCCCVCCCGSGVDPIRKGHRLEREPRSPHWQIWHLLCRDGHLGSKLPGNSLYAIGLMRFVLFFAFVAFFSCPVLRKTASNLIEISWSHMMGLFLFFFFENLHFWTWDVNPLAACNQWQVNRFSSGSPVPYGIVPPTPSRGRVWSSTPDPSEWPSWTNK